MAASIEQLASYLKPNERKIMKKYYSSEEQFKLLSRKGVFPYDYVDDWSKLSENQLPTKVQFHNKLNYENISDAGYEHAQKVWQSFGIKNLGEYSDLYLKTDVLLLADIFKNFRECSLQTYKLDALHYYTAPGLSWDAMLKMTGVKLELLTDIDKILFIEAGIRGGVVSVFKSIR